jgi:P-type E1-E2 ATPase
MSMDHMAGQMRARGRASDAIRALLDLSPPKALVLRDGEPVEVPTAEVAVGDLLLIRPGAKIAVDAQVTEGESEVDESAVTGESMPVRKHGRQRPGCQARHPVQERRRPGTGGGAGHDRLR